MFPWRRVGLELLAVVLLAGVVFARPAGEFPMFLKLNGEPSLVGVLTSAGSSVSNVDAGTPFAVTGGTVYKVQCDANAFVNVGPTSSATYTNANIGQLVTTSAPLFIVTKDSTSSLSSISASGTANCPVFKLE